MDGKDYKNMSKLIFGCIVALSVENPIFFNILDFKKIFFFLINNTFIRTKQK